MTTSPEGSTASPTGGPGMSLYGFARRVKVALPQVLKAVDNGRLSRSLGVDGRGKPCIKDVDLAEQEWEENRVMRKVRGLGPGSRSIVCCANVSRVWPTAAAAPKSDVTTVPLTTHTRRAHREKPTENGHRSYQPVGRRQKCPRRSPCRRQRAKDYARGGRGRAVWPGQRPPATRGNDRRRRAADRRPGGPVVGGPRPGAHRCHPLG